MWQQQATPPPERDQQTMTANLDFLRADGTEGRENAERHLEFRHLFGRERSKARVVKGGGARRLYHRAVERSDGIHMADATPQIPPRVERGEYAARLGQVRRRRGQRDGAAPDRGGNRLVSQLQQERALGGRKLVSIGAARAGCIARGKRRIFRWRGHCVSSAG